ncbi:MAG TPA: IclR family transcriptional regulator [Burkholderiaceae bacterium]|nr:IclR family transcriptional regulator [Burkholderiaceae bacterium]
MPPTPTAASDRGTPGKPRRGIQSIEVGGQLLVALVQAGAPMTLRDLSRTAGMPPAKAHPYLVSFGNLGLVKQDPHTGEYLLGPMALQLGLVALHGLDPVNEALAEVGQLAAAIEQAVAIAVWGNHGATIVHYQESSNPIHVNMRTGTVMSLVETATGRTFAAFLPPKLCEKLAQEEIRRVAEGPAAVRELERQFEQGLGEIRRRGLARALGKPMPGINALCAPVFDHAGNIVLVITAMGPAGSFDAAWDGAIAREVHRCAERISQRLGHPVAPAADRGARS